MWPRACEQTVPGKLVETEERSVTVEATLWASVGWAECRRSLIIEVLGKLNEILWREQLVFPSSSPVCLLFSHIPLSVFDILQGLA